MPGGNRGAVCRLDAEKRFKGENRECRGKLAKAPGFRFSEDIAVIGPSWRCAGIEMNCTMHQEFLWGPVFKTRSPAGRLGRFANASYSKRGLHWNAVAGRRDFLLPATSWLELVWGDIIHAAIQLEAGLQVL